MTKQPEKKQISVLSIISDIKQSIQNDKLSSLDRYHTHPTECIFLYKNDTTPLVHGWHEIDPRYEDGFRWTKKEFSFFYNPGSTTFLSFHIISLPPGKHKEELSLKLYRDDLLIGEKGISTPGLVTFNLPDKTNKICTFTAKLSYDTRPVEMRLNEDIRHLGVGIRAITSAPVSVASLNYYNSLYEQWVTVKKEMHIRRRHMKAHVDPHHFIDKNTPSRFLKLLLYRMLRLYTSVQSRENAFFIEQMDALYKTIEIQMNLTYEMQMYPSRSYV